MVTYTRGRDLSGSLQGAGGIGGLLARTDQTASTPSHAYYHADGNGNVTAMISYQQNLVAKYLYDPFGNILSKSGWLADANTYRFSSKEWHTGSLLYYHGFTYYSPTFQRWMNRDPIGVRGGCNLYQYAYNCPIFYVDIYRLAPEGRLIGGGIGGWIGGIIGGGFGVVGGGAGGTVIEPGGGTIVGGVEGGIVGGEIGAGIGADIGGAIGAIIGDILTDQLNSVPDDRLSDSDKYPLSNRDKNLAKRPSMKGDKECPPPKTGDETGNREPDREQFHKNKSREGRRPTDNYGGEGRRPSGYGPTD